MKNIILNTKRLEIISGTLEHIRSEINNRVKFSALINAQIPDNWPPPLNDEQSQNYFLKYAEENPDTKGFSFWYIVLIEGNKRDLIGGIGFKGKPSEDGTIEIGYSIMETHHRNGYASEAVAALVNWAFSQENVFRVIAETFPDLIPSQKVLEKSGFRFIGEGSEPGIIRFELKREDYSVKSD